MGADASEGTLFVVDDDADLRTLIAEFFSQEGYAIRVAGSVSEARDLMAFEAPDLVLVDINMPGGSGLELVGELRQRSAVPVIILSGKGSMVDRVVGLEVGADDYLPKPFELRELLARVRAVLRRARGANGAASDAADAPAEETSVRQARFDVFILTPSRRDIATTTGARVDLTASEFNLLTAFVERANRVISRDAVAELTHKQDWDGFDRSVDTIMSRLRRKLVPYTVASQLLKTVRGEGYILASRVTWSGTD